MVAGHHSRPVLLFDSILLFSPHAGMVRASAARQIVNQTATPSTDSNSALPMRTMY